MLEPLKHEGSHATKIEQFTDQSVNDRAILQIVPVIVFAFAFVLAFLIKLAAEHWIPEGTFRILADHVSIAIIVASVLGLTYEYVLHHQREFAIQRIFKEFRRMFDEHQEKVVNSLEAYALFYPGEVFELLRDIASQTSETPTLYRPARKEAEEYTFSKRIDYFDRLIAVRRKDIEKILRSWIRNTDSPNVKFLASDFIGKYKLKELANELRPEVEKGFLELNKEDSSDRGWILNYIWAISRCEEPMYDRLGKLLCSTNDEWIQGWILGVPLQMPDKEFGGIISEYLKRDDISVENGKRVIRAVAALNFHDPAFDPQSIFKDFRNKFHDQELIKEVDDLAKLCAMAGQDQRRDKNVE